MTVTTAYEMPDPHADFESYHAQIGDDLYSYRIHKLYALVTGIERSHKWDKKTGPGMKDARATYQARELLNWTLTVTSWGEPGHSMLWQFAVMFDGNSEASGKGDSPSPLAISHPSLHKLGVDRFFVDKVSHPEWDRVGKWTLVAQCFQWVRIPDKPPNITTTPTQVIPVDNLGTTAANSASLPFAKPPSSFIGPPAPPTAGGAPTSTPASKS